MWWRPPPKRCDQLDVKKRRAARREPGGAALFAAPGKKTPFPPPLQGAILAAGLQRQEGERQHGVRLYPRQYARTKRRPAVGGDAADGRPGARYLHRQAVRQRLRPPGLQGAGAPPAPLRPALHQKHRPPGPRLRRSAGTVALPDQGEERRYRGAGYAIAGHAPRPAAWRAAPFTTGPTATGRPSRRSKRPSRRPPQGRNKKPPRPGEGAGALYVRITWPARRCAWPAGPRSCGWGRQWPRPRRRGSKPARSMPHTSRRRRPGTSRAGAARACGRSGSCPP